MGFASAHARRATADKPLYPFLRAGCATLRDANLARFKIQLLASRHALLW
jgi:hypothetical protein